MNPPSVDSFDALRTILKYPVPVKDAFEIDLHLGAAVLCVQTQGHDGPPFIWVESIESREKKTRKFRLFGTGHPIANAFELRYIGTFQQEDGHFVFHLYEQVPV